MLEKQHKDRQIPEMDKIDRNIAEILQSDGRKSSAEIASATGVSVSTANERVRRLTSKGVVKAVCAILDPDLAGVSLCAFMLVDMDYEGEDAACEMLATRKEVLELHHISGAHSYLMKVRVAGSDALQRFLQEVVKPLKAVRRTESIMVLDTVKETTEVLIGDVKGGTQARS